MINEDVPTNSIGPNIAGTNNDITWKKVKSALWNRKKKMKTFKEFVEEVNESRDENIEDTHMKTLVHDENHDNHADKIEKDPAKHVKTASTPLLHALKYHNMGWSGVNDHPAIKHINAELVKRRKNRAGK